MRTINPLRGLLRYFYYDSSGNIKIVVMVALVLAIAALLTENFVVKNIFNMVSLGGIPYLLIMKMGGKNYPKWERFQLTMPITRSQLIGSQYLCISIGSLVGIPLVIIVGILNFGINDIDYEFTVALINTLGTLGLPFALAGVLFPLGSTKFGENKGEMFFMVGFAVAVGINFLTTFLGNTLEWRDGLASAISFIVSIAIFVISYFITAGIYAKNDF
jgi:hypothetical protein